eukprot:GHVO01065950.1.p1 GENE.GHVO01065950.1~~GHVO01065950.1.p1  ORF type:complete len:121 (+),score=12.49 GHVO01065950.1:117-479(+)
MSPHAPPKRDAISTPPWSQCPHAMDTLTCILLAHWPAPPASAHPPFHLASLLQHNAELLLITISNTTHQQTPLEHHAWQHQFISARPAGVKKVEEGKDGMGSGEEDPGGKGKVQVLRGEG